MRERERESELVAYNVFLMSRGCYCSLPLPQGVVCWSAVCERVISWSYSLSFCFILTEVLWDISDLLFVQHKYYQYPVSDLHILK